MGLCVGATGIGIQRILNLSDAPVSGAPSAASVAAPVVDELDKDLAPLREVKVDAEVEPACVEEYGNECPEVPLKPCYKAALQPHLQSAPTAVDVQLIKFG